VPSAVLVTRHDSVVPPSRQMRLARALAAAEIVEVDGDHDVFLEAPGLFVRALVRACLAVVTSDDGSRGGTERAS
jgi:3-oxoadipate enol-lactonase